MKAYRDETTGRWHSDLPDVFDTICHKLRNGERFSFARFGDGEFNAIYGKKGANCDGHEYFPDMGKRLREILESHPNYMMGLQPLTVTSDRMKQIAKDFPGIEWVDADSIHNASIDGKMDEFFDAVYDRRCVIVGPQHLMKLNIHVLERAGWLGVNHFPIHDFNCWSYDYELCKNYLKSLNTKDIVILFCASMMSEVLIDEFHQDATCIDLGSVLDPYCGVKSRRYHHKLSI